MVVMVVVLGEDGKFFPYLTSPLCSSLLFDFHLFFNGASASIIGKALSLAVAEVVRWWNAGTQLSRGANVFCQFAPQ